MKDHFLRLQWTLPSSICHLCFYPSDGIFCRYASPECFRLLAFSWHFQPFYKLPTNKTNKYEIKIHVNFYARFMPSCDASSHLLQAQKGMKRMNKGLPWQFPASLVSRCIRCHLSRTSRRPISTFAPIFPSTWRSMHTGTLGNQLFHRH